MLENRRGQQIGEYGVLLGTVALAVLSMQTVLGRSLLGSLEYNSQQVLGPPVLDNATTVDSQATTTVEERAPLPGRVSTTVDAPAHGVTTVGTLIADASEPIVGVAITGSYGKRLPAAPLALRSSGTLAARPRRDVYLEAAARQKKGDKVTGPQIVEDLDHSGERKVSIESGDWSGGEPNSISFGQGEVAQPVSIKHYPVKSARSAAQGGLVVIALADGDFAVVNVNNLGNYAKSLGKGKDLKFKAQLVYDDQTGLFEGVDTDGDGKVDQTPLSYSQDGSTLDAFKDADGHVKRVDPAAPGVKVSKDDLSKTYEAMKEQLDTGGSVDDALPSLDSAGVSYKKTTLSDLARDSHQTPSSKSASLDHQEYLNNDGNTPIVSVSDAVHMVSSPAGYDRNGDGQVDGQLVDTDGNLTYDTITFGSLLPSGVYGPPDFQGAAKIVSTPRVRLSNEATWREAMATGQGLSSYAEYRAFYKVEHGNVAGAGRKGLKAWIADRFPIAAQVAPGFFSDVVGVEGGASEAAGGAMPTTPPLTTGSPLVGGQPTPSVKDKPQ